VRNNVGLEVVRYNPYTPLLDDMVELIYWLAVFQVFSTFPFASTQRSRKFFRESLVFSQFFEDGLMREVSDILGIIKGGRH